MSSREDRIGAAAAIYWALIILLFPLSWIAAVGTAALIHEMGHYVALRCCGVKIYKFKIGITGALLETGSLSSWQELVCSLAGPLTGLLPILAIRWIPRVAFCALAQSVFNLLPIYPLDGGRCLRCIGNLLSIPEKCCTVFGYLVLCGLGFLAVYGAMILHLGIAPVVAVVILFIKARGKRPCKPQPHWV